jgi:SPP1 gp7 family putative phage head morphogenesis protein
MCVNEQIYRAAFQTFLRKGTPIEWSLKQARTERYYIWRTRDDEKVRPSHSANDGKIFSWDDPPPTGNPGDDFGCRCKAEPFDPEAAEYIRIELGDVFDSGPAWSSRDFVRHYYQGGGQGVTVRETGHLVSIADRYINLVQWSLKKNIAEKARENPDGAFMDEFINTYTMTGVAFSIGDTTIGGSFSGRASMLSGVIAVSGELEFYLTDKFIDPLDIGVEVIDPGETVYENLLGPLNDHGRQQLGLPPNEPERPGIHTGEPFTIADKWSGRFVGQVHADPRTSAYR